MDSLSHASMARWFMRVSHRRGRCEFVLSIYASMEFKIPCEYEAGPCEFPYHIMRVWNLKFHASMK